MGVDIVVIHQPLGGTHRRAGLPNLKTQRHRPPVPRLQHLERRKQRRPQTQARAAECDGDAGLERVGEAVDDHTKLVVAQRDQEAARVVVAAAATRRHRRQTPACGMQLTVIR